MALPRILHRQHPQLQNEGRLCSHRRLPLSTCAKGRGLLNSGVFSWCMWPPVSSSLGGNMSPLSFKQHLAVIRVLFDAIGQIIPTNPAHSVREPRHSVSKGSTPVLSSEEATALLTGMDVSSVGGLRDRAIIALMTYTFARVGAVVALATRKRLSLVCHIDLMVRICFPAQGSV
jgi:hypothetical protein